MNSKWYEKELENYRQSRMEAKGNTPKSVIGITIFFIMIAGIMIYVYTTDPKYQIGISLGTLGGVYAFIMLIILLTQMAANKKSENLSLDDLQNGLNRILTSPESVEEFDSEMFAQPLKYLVNTTNQQIYITEHYFMDKGILMGAPYYTVARLDEIKSLRSSGFKDKSKINPLAREYYVDLLNEDNKKIAGLNIKGKDTLMELKQTLNLE